MKLAFAGNAGCGKTELSKYLMRRYNFKKISFADDVKLFARKILGRPVDKKTERRFLQIIGCGARECDSEVWIRRLDNKIFDCELNGQYNLVVDDCRFLNEAAFLRNRGFIVIKLTGRKYDLSEALANDESERQVEMITGDYEINTGGTLANSFMQLEIILRSIGYVDRRRRK